MQHGLFFFRFLFFVYQKLKCFVFFFLFDELFISCCVLIIEIRFVQGIIAEMPLVSFLDFLLFKNIKFCRIVNLCFGVKKLRYREIMEFLFFLCFWAV